MVEKQENPKNHEWEKIIKKLEEYLQNIDVWIELTGRLEFSPLVFAESDNAPSWPELTGKERESILKKVFSEFEVDPDSDENIGEYSFEAPKTATWEGTARVKTFKTNNPLYDLHEINRPGGKEKEYFLAKKGYKL